MRSLVRPLTVLGCGVLVAASAAAQKQATPPTPEALLKRACDAAGGMKAFNDLGILAVAAKSEEVTQEGEVTSILRTTFFLAPGPVPGRFEFPEKKVVAGDDGSGGWAILDQKPDPRFATTFKVQRSLATTLFPVLLPFSLTWKGVGYQGDVKPAVINGRPVWQLAVELPRNFFENPQISTSWTVSIDRSTGAVVRADSPFTDLGKGVTADGMRFTWREPVKVGGVTLYKEQKLTGSGTGEGPQPPRPHAVPPPPGSRCREAVREPDPAGAATEAAEGAASTAESSAAPQRRLMRAGERAARGRRSDCGRLAVRGNGVH